MKNLFCFGRVMPEGYLGPLSIPCAAEQYYLYAQDLLSGLKHTALQ